jgi:hypothetical protein
VVSDRTTGLGQRLIGRASSSGYRQVVVWQRLRTPAGRDIAMTFRGEHPLFDPGDIVAVQALRGRRRTWALTAQHIATGRRWVSIAVVRASVAVALGGVAVVEIAAGQAR